MGCQEGSKRRTTERKQCFIELFFRAEPLQRPRSKSSVCSTLRWPTAGSSLNKRRQGVIALPVAVECVQ